MKLEEVIAEIEEVSQRFSFVLQVIRLDETKYSVKYLLMLAEDFFVQVYRNVRSGTIGLALIYRGQRLYGRDREGGQWHRHPFENPMEHDFSAEGSRKVSLEEFLEEVREILERGGLI
jgi:hypothetical protein